MLLSDEQIKARKEHWVGVRASTSPDPRAAKWMLDEGLCYGVIYDEGGCVIWEGPDRPSAESAMEDAKRKLSDLELQEATDATE